MTVPDSCSKMLTLAAACRCLFKHWVPKFLGLLLAADACCAQVIQLPSFRNFSYSGGALVPDAGTAYWGGVGYGSQRSFSRGGPVYGQRGIGSSVGGAGLSVSVDVIDLEALDQAILSARVPQIGNQPTASQSSQGGGSTAVDDADKARRFISGYRSATSAQEPTDHRDYLRSLRSAPERRMIDESLAESNIRYYLRKGQEAEDANRIQSARVYYRMALESMSPQLLDRYQRILASRKSPADLDSAGSNSNRKPF